VAAGDEIESDSAAAITDDGQASADVKVLVLIVITTDINVNSVHLFDDQAFVNGSGFTTVLEM